MLRAVGTYLTNAPQLRGPDPAVPRELIDVQSFIWTVGAYRDDMHGAVP